MLGLAREQHAWTAREIALLRRHYPTADWSELEALCPWASRDQITSAANYHRIFRKRRPYKQTGVPVLDAIRSRCFEALDALLERVPDTLDDARATCRYLSGVDRPGDRPVAMDDDQVDALIEAMAGGQGA